MNTERRRFGFWAFLLGAAVFAFLTFRFPDLDIKLLGIGKHRYFLFHSAIIPLVAVWLHRKIRSVPVLGIIAVAFVVGFLAGVGVHLVTDVFQKTKIYFPFIGTLVDGTSVDDRLWEGGNALLCFGSAWRVGSKHLHRSTDLSSGNTSLRP